MRGRRARTWGGIMAGTPLDQAAGGRVLEDFTQQLAAIDQQAVQSRADGWAVGMWSNDACAGMAC